MSLCLRLIPCTVLLLGAVLLFASQVRPVRADDTKPNVLFIAVDDMRVELGCYGQEHIQSPNLDALARRGTLFERAYCQQAVCNPSRASVMTGLYPWSFPLWDLPTHFRERKPDVVTLPRFLRQHGYHARDIGKIFHNWRQDDWKGDPASWSVPAVMHYNSHSADQPVVEGEVPPDLEPTPRCEMRDVPDEAYFDGRIAALAVEALGELKSKQQPWFLAVGFWKPHAGFNAPKKYWDLYERDEIRLAENGKPPENVPEIALHDSREILRGFKTRPMTDEDARALRHGYYAAISYVDAQIGKVIDELDRLGLAKNTIIVFWSDHGFHLGEHGLWAKTSNFELDARVPLIIATPNHRGDQTTRALVELVDLYPTIVDLCGLPVDDGLEGRSLRVLLDDPHATVKSTAVTWHPRPAYPKSGEDPEVMGYSVRTDRFRYTEWRAFGDDTIVARELYDHANDPQESVNVIDDAEFKDQIEESHQSVEALIHK